MKKFNRILYIIISCCIISQSGMSQTIAGVYSVGCTAYTQEQTQWCWAACTRMVDWTYSSTTPPSQCTIVNKANDQCDGIFNTCCNTLNGSRPSACTTPASSNYPNNMGSCNGSLSWLINHYAGANSYSGSSLTYSAVSSNLAANKMMVARWGWTSGGGHFVVIYACYTFNGAGQVQYANPASGSKVTESYTYFKSNSSRNWTHSISMNGAAYHTREGNTTSTMELNNVRVYPNPASDIVNIERFNDNLAEATFTLMNALGEVVFTKTISASEMVSTIQLPNDLQKGIYFIQIDNEGVRNTEKILIN